MFIPRKSKIFDNLVKLSEVVLEASKVFNETTHDWGQLSDGSELLEALEKRADEQVHRINDDSEKYFILPLDKEDLSELTESLDDVVDNIEQVANRLKIYRLPETNDPMRKFSNLILQAAEQVQRCILLIKERKMTSPEYANCYKKLQDLESEGNQIHRDVLEGLLGESSTDLDMIGVLYRIKWKEIFQTLEDTLDKYEDVAVIFSRLRVKYR